MPKGIPNKRHTREFKQEVAQYIKGHKLPCVETGKIFETDHKNVALWERTYFKYGVEGSYLERQGRGGKSKLASLPKQVEEDLLIKNQRLRAENDYLKNFHALVSERIR